MYIYNVKDVWCRCGHNIEKEYEEVVQLIPKMSQIEIILVWNFFGYISYQFQSEGVQCSVLKKSLNKKLDLKKLITGMCQGMGIRNIY